MYAGCAFDAFIHLHNYLLARRNSMECDSITMHTETWWDVHIFKKKSSLHRYLQNQFRSEHQQLHWVSACRMQSIYTHRRRRTNGLRRWYGRWPVGLYQIYYINIVYLPIPCLSFKWFWNPELCWWQQSKSNFTELQINLCTEDYAFRKSMVDFPNHAFFFLIA